MDVTPPATEPRSALATPIPPKPRIDAREVIVFPLFALAHFARRLERCNNTCSSGRSWMAVSAALPFAAESSSEVCDSFMRPDSNAVRKASMSALVGAPPPTRVSARSCISRGDSERYLAPSLEHAQHGCEVERFTRRDAQERVEGPRMKPEVVLIHCAQDLRLRTVELRITITNWVRECGGCDCCRCRGRVPHYLVRLDADGRSDLLGKPGGRAAADDSNFAALRNSRLLQLVPYRATGIESTSCMLRWDAVGQLKSPTRGDAYPVGGGARGGKVETVTVGAILHVLRVHARAQDDSHPVSRS
eukprot:scaffold249199_cov27-Tisochrysis_lutea.AAC.2